jgi:hypothetical protein
MPHCRVIISYNNAKPTRASFSIFLVGVAGICWAACCSYGSDAPTLDALPTLPTRRIAFGRDGGEIVATKQCRS